MVESSKRCGVWRHDVRVYSRQQYTGSVITGPVFVEMIFYMPRPKGHYRTGKFAGELKPNAPVYCSTTPDVDKLCRSTLDGLSTATGGCVLADDNLVVGLVAEKRYVNTGGCGATIRLIKR